MNIWYWVVIAVVVIGVIWMVMKRKKGGQGPQVPPSSQPPQM